MAHGCRGKKWTTRWLEPRSHGAIVLQQSPGVEGITSSVEPELSDGEPNFDLPPLSSMHPFFQNMFEKQHAAQPLPETDEVMYLN